MSHPNPSLDWCNAEEYAEHFTMSYAWGVLCDEMYWEDDFDAELCLKVMLREAHRDGFELAGLDRFKYEDYFYESYRNTEKGLS